MVGHGGSSAGSYLADPTSPIPSHCASIVTTSTVRVKMSIDLVSYSVPISVDYYAAAQISRGFQIKTLKFSMFENRISGSQLPAIYQDHDYRA